MASTRPTIRILTGTFHPELVNPSISYINTIGRTVHLNEFEENERLENFRKRYIERIYKTIIIQGCYTWFRTNMQTQHDCYGNVLYEIDVSKLLLENYRYYLADFVHYGGNKTSSRIIVTRHRLKLPGTREINLRESDPTIPVAAIDDNTLCFVKSHDFMGRRRTHDVHFVFDRRSINMRKFYRLCRKTPVDHSYANKARTVDGKFTAAGCVIYNGRQWHCPFQLTTELCRERMAEIISRHKKQASPAKLQSSGSFNHKIEEQIIMKNTTNHSNCNCSSDLINSNYGINCSCNRKDYLEYEYYNMPIYNQFDLLSSISNFSDFLSLSSEQSIFVKEQDLRICS